MTTKTEIAMGESGWLRIIANVIAKVASGAFVVATLLIGIALKQVADYVPPDQVLPSAVIATDLLLGVGASLIGVTLGALSDYLVGAGGS
ncbi:MAG TPA: hypothetical protein VGM67_19815 [Gemmatimonadaceae bacterium]